MDYKAILNFFNLNNSYFDFRYNFAYPTTDPNKYNRGGREYYRPYGWYRVGLKIAGKYDNGNDDWMKDNHNTNEWVNAYHGTKIENVKGILENGLKPGTNNAFGVGIYCSPKVETAEAYAKEFEYNKQYYKVVIQVRVKPDTIQETKLKGGPIDYWYIEDTKDIRNLCILLKKKETIPPPLPPPPPQIQQSQPIIPPTTTTSSTNSTPLKVNKTAIATPVQQTKPSQSVNTSNTLISNIYIRILRKYKMDDSYFNFRFNYQFGVVDNVKFKRGGRDYYRPCGWYRIGLNISGRYDNGNDDWLKDNNNPGEWINAYYGTNIENVKSIIENGLKKKWYEYGIYCCEKIEDAEKYGSEFEFEGEKYKVVIQVRVKPDKIVECKGKDYWYVKDSKDIRNFCMLIKKNQTSPSQNKPTQQKQTNTSSSSLSSPLLQNQHKGSVLKRCCIVM